MTKIEAILFGAAFFVLLWLMIHPKNNKPKKLIMKKLIALIIGLTAVGLTGCKTTPDTTAYKISLATQIGAEESLRLWDVYLQTQQAAGKPVSAADELKVKNAFTHYQNAALLVVDAGRAYTRARSLGNDATAAQLYQIALDSAMKAKIDLFNVLQSLGLKLLPN